MSSLRKGRYGFTIVELLVVIVVIAILAAISIVAYNGIKTSSIDTTLKSDAEGVAKLLANDSTVNGTYPLTGTAANSGKGLPKSGVNTYVYTPNLGVTPQTYTLTYSNTGSANSYAVTSTNNVPTLVSVSPPVITAVNWNNICESDDIVSGNLTISGATTVKLQTLPWNSATGTFTDQTTTIGGPPGYGGYTNTFQSSFSSGQSGYIVGRITASNSGGSVTSGQTTVYTINCSP